jgi:recombination protein RecT
MNAPATAVARARESLLDTIESHRAELASYLPPGADLNRFIATLRQMIFDVPGLLECSVPSVLSAARAAAQSGLPIDGRFSSLIVRKPKNGPPIAIWDPSFRGMIWLALESGFVLDVQSGVVRESDFFEFDQGSEPRLVHRCSLLPKQGEVIAAYATAKLRAGGTMIEILTRSDIARIRAMSPAGDRGPWGSWADMMSRKSAVRRLLKRLPAGTVRNVEPALPSNLTAPAPAIQPAAPAIAHGAGEASTVTPEDAFRLECRALEQLADANSVAALQAAWTQTRSEYSQAGADIPVKVEAAFHDRREALAQLEQR